MATDKYNNRRLQELSHSDYEIADGEPKIKGWDVKLSTGEEVGEVEDLIFDTQSLKVRYLVVDLEGKVLDMDSREVLVPIGLAQLQNLTHDVILNNVTISQLKALPEYDDEDELSPDYENRVRQSFSDTYMGTGTVTTDTDSDFYNHQLFNDENFYARDTEQPDRNINTVDSGRDTSDNTIEVVKENFEVGKRTVQTGGIRVRSRIVETPVEETVRLREENVNVERVPVDRMATGAAFSEKEIEMTETSEVPVVNKEARVVEEITVSKDVEERDETIRDTIKETEVDINDETPANKKKNQGRK